MVHSELGGGVGGGDLSSKNHGFSEGSLIPGHVGGAWGRGYSALGLGLPVPQT